MSSQKPFTLQYVIDNIGKTIVAAYDMAGLMTSGIGIEVGRIIIDHDAVNVQDTKFHRTVTFTKDETGLLSLNGSPLFYWEFTFENT